MLMNRKSTQTSIPLILSLLIVLAASGTVSSEGAEEANGTQDLQRRRGCHRHRRRRRRDALSAGDSRSSPLETYAAAVDLLEASHGRRARQPALRHRLPAGGDRRRRRRRGSSTTVAWSFFQDLVEAASLMHPTPSSTWPSPTSTRFRSRARSPRSSSPVHVARPLHLGARSSKRPGSDSTRGVTPISSGPRSSDAPRTASTTSSARSSSRERPWRARPYPRSGLGRPRRRSLAARRRRGRALDSGHRDRRPSPTIRIWRSRLSRTERTELDTFLEAHYDTTRARRNPPRGDLRCAGLVAERR